MTMPYIDKLRREPLYMGWGQAITAGELNYVFTKLALKYRNRHPKLHDELVAEGKAYLGRVLTTYSSINDVMGALTCASLEFVRRTGSPDLMFTFAAAQFKFYDDVAVPYEKTKIEENGDVYPRPGKPALIQ
jgi:hypothetical protein